MATKTMKRNSNLSENTEIVKEDKPVVKERKKFEKDDFILCRSMTIGTLIMEGTKTKDTYIWTNYGDVTEVQYQDLTGLVTRKSEYIYHPFFVIEDEDFIEIYPQLQKFYDEQFTTEELEDIFALDNRSMKATIEKLPKGAKDTLKILASSKVFSGEIDSVSKIKALDECFDTELNLMSSLIN